MKTSHLIHKQESLIVSSDVWKHYSQKAFKILFFNLSAQVGKGDGHQAQRPKFSLQDPYGEGEKQLTYKLSSDIHTCIQHATNTHKTT